MSTPSVYPLDLHDCLIPNIMTLNPEKGELVEQQVKVTGLKHDIKKEANEDSHSRSPLEKSLVRKADLLIIPLMALAYLLVCDILSEGQN